MTLGEKQRLFTHLQAKLVIWAYEQGYELTDGDAYRDPRLHGEHGEQKGYGSAYSRHKQRLARDYNLFINGVYQETTEAWAEIGEHWENMNELCTWGGRFEDGNHLSFEEHTA
jgi:hypothetical protein